MLIKFFILITKFFPTKIRSNSLSIEKPKRQKTIHRHTKEEIAIDIISLGTKLFLKLEHLKLNLNVEIHSVKYDKL